jgi:hypothetical protein
MAVMQRPLTTCVLLWMLCSPVLAAAGEPPPSHPALPSEVSINKGAGRGGLLMIMLRMGTPQEFPFVLDTGMPVTIFDKSLLPRLGRTFGRVPMLIFDKLYEIEICAMPQLYSGSTPLMREGSSTKPKMIARHGEYALRLEGNYAGVADLEKIAAGYGVKVMGILGMDCLHHYCIQLDFAAGRLRFLDDESPSKDGWGKPFSLLDRGDGCFCIAENLAGTKGANSLIDTGCATDGVLTDQVFQQWTNHATRREDSDTVYTDAVLGGEIYPSAKLRVIAGSGHDNYIGLRLLARHLVTLDFPKRMTYLKRVSTEPLGGEREQELWMAVKKFIEKGLLPGFARGETCEMRPADIEMGALLEEVYPVHATFDARKNGGPWCFHFTFVRLSKESAWKLQKGWQTRPGYLILELFNSAP